MGCWFVKPSEAAQNGKTEAVKYSWDERAKINPAEFTIDKLKDTTTGRLPGTVNGQQFVISNCEDCNIYIFDHCNMVTIDDCCRSNILIGAVKGSIFIRNCSECKFVLACQQFRVRDCQKIDVYLSVTTQPIIESSSAVKFACFSFNYPQLENHFRNAGLSEFNNNWNDVHDFTPIEGETNWGFISNDNSAEYTFPLPTTDELSDIKISTSPADSFVPHTLGLRRRNSDESCLIVFFNDGQSHQRAKSFIQALDNSSVTTNLINTKEVSLEASTAKNIFNSESYSQVIARGPVIGLEYNGADTVRDCQTTAMRIAKESGSTGLLYVSSNATIATKQIETFFNYANMK
uniref:Protein XRP2 n=1 Tax=Strigamia maritima TaxID=126957 RepID=T1IP16_STRMM